MIKSLLKSAVCVLLLIGTAAILASCTRQYTPKNYENKVSTGGDIEAKYLARGEHDVKIREDGSLQGFGKYIIHYPTDLESENKKYPVVVFVNGTGVSAKKYKYLLSHMASWGFIVIGTEEEMDWNGFSAEMCIRHLEKLNEQEVIDEKSNIFYGKIDLESVGITGHSQGGVGVINAITKQEHSSVFKAAVALSPTNYDLASSIEWEYDIGSVNIPIMIASGAGGGDDWVITGDQLLDMYESISSDKIMLRRSNTDHGAMLYSADGYVTAFFMWQLCGDEYAAGAFLGEHAELLENPLYEDQKISISDTE